MPKIAMAAAFCLLSVTLCAQWFNFRQPGILRTPDGKPDLTTPAPRAPDGKPDLSGLWGGGADTGQIAPGADLIQDIKDEVIFKPVAEAIFQKRRGNFSRDWPPHRCLPVGPANAWSGNYRIIQSPTIVALLFNSDVGDDYRQIYLDGRELPRDPSPTWHGYSIGHWEKSESGTSEDTLVVESAGFNDRSWLDSAGHPHSESLRVTERFHRVDFGHLQVQVTFDDPQMLNGPLTVRRVKNYQADADMLEGVCEDRDSPHLVGEASKGVKLSAAVLAKYAGTYELRQGAGRPAPITLVLADGQLYIGALPLIPESETSFHWYDGTAVNFSLDAAGTVTGFRRVFGYSGESGFYVKR